MPINKEDLESMKQELEEYDEKREKLIKEHRDVLKISKKIIHSVHRNDLEEAEKTVEKIKKKKEKLQKIVGDDPFMMNEGSYKVALQEFTEAINYYNLVKNDKILSRSELSIPSKYYLLGLCDLTGELRRRAINLTGEGKYDKAIKIKELVDEIYEGLLDFDFRRGELRKKFDSVKHDLKELEDLRMEIKLNKK